MFEFLERLGDLFSNGDGSHYDTSGHESVVDGFDGSTLDLSQYSPDDIEDAVRNALGTDNGLHDTGHGYDISFGADHTSCTFSAISSAKAFNSCGSATSFVSIGCGV